MATEDTQMKKTLNILKKMKVSTRVPRVIAEIGCNHMGDFDLAKKMITKASDCGAYAVKFQKRCVEEKINDEIYLNPHPNKMHSFGSTYYEHRKFLEFDINQHKELKKFARTKSIEYSCSVWDVTSANEIISLNPKFIKVPSACNNNLKLLEKLILNFSGDIHVSLGMTNKQEENVLIETFKKHNSLKRLVLYSCTSSYPCKFEDVSLLEIIRIKEKYEDHIKDIGFSGHHLGIAVDIASYALGANWIERHFTLDRTFKGTDHIASLEPTGLRKLCRDLHATKQSLKYKDSDILHCEISQRKKLKFI